MKRANIVAIIVFAFLPAVCAAQSVFDGTWKTEVSSIDFPTKPSVFVFKDGAYECKTCAVPVVIKADGKDQKVTGDPYADTLSVKIVDANHVEIVSKKGGKVVARSKYSVSTDRNSMLHEYTANSSVNAEVVKGTTSYARIAYDKASTTQMSGSWKAIKADKVSDNGLLITYKSDGAMMTVSKPTGESFSAKTDGTEAPYKGDPGITTVSVKVRKNTLEAIYKRDGKDVGMTKMEVDAAGKKAKVDWINNLTRTNGNYSMVKQ